MADPENLLSRAFVWPTDEFGPYPTRGLIVNPKFSARFTAEKPSERKTMEVRNHRCRCLQPLENFLLLESGVGKNQHGVTLMKAVAILGFAENISFDINDYSMYEDMHALTKEEFQQLQQGWCKKSPTSTTAFGWKVHLVRKLLQPLFFQWRNQELFFLRDVKSSKLSASVSRQRLALTHANNKVQVSVEHGS